MNIFLSSMSTNLKHKPERFLISVEIISFISVKLLIKLSFISFNGGLNEIFTLSILPFFFSLFSDFFK